MLINRMVIYFNNKIKLNKELYFYSQNKSTIIRFQVK